MRSNCHTALYCDIAMEAYYDALQLHSALNAAEWHLAPGIDNYDAFKDTFSPLDLLYGNDDEITIREVVFPNLGLDFTKENLERIVIAQAKHAQLKK